MGYWNINTAYLVLHGSHIRSFPFKVVIEIGNSYSSPILTWCVGQKATGRCRRLHIKLRHGKDGVSFVVWVYSVDTSIDEVIVATGPRITFAVNNCILSGTQNIVTGNCIGENSTNI